MNGRHPSTSISDLAPDARVSLTRRAREVIVVYREHRLPAACEPATARVGIGPAGTAGAALYIDRGVTYRGDDRQLEQWVTDGTRYFSAIDEAIEWIVQRVPAAAPEPVSQVGVAHRPELPEPSSVTRLGDVSPAPSPSTGVGEADLLASLMGAISGQDAAISRLAAGVSRHTGKTYPRKPYSAVLLGMPATGKTQTARRLVDGLTELSGADWRLIRLDGAEFAERINVSRIVGASHNYVGYGDGTDLASMLAEQPRTVVLFDEVEKAHPAVVHSLLGLLDSGRLRSEARGTVASEHAILLFTSNLGADELGGAVLSDGEGRTHLRRHGLSPELVSRFGDVLSYATLSGSALAEVAARSVALIAGDYGLRVDWIAPAYLSDLLARQNGNRLGVRIIEYLVDADLGAEFARLARRGVVRARVDFDAVPIAVPSDAVGEPVAAATEAS